MEQSHPCLDHTITMAEILRRWPQTGPALLAAGLPCMGCTMASFQTIKEAAAYHDMEEARLRHILASAIPA